MVIISLVLVMTSLVKLTSGTLIGLSGVLYEAIISSLIKPILIILMLGMLFLYYTYLPSEKVNRDGLLVIQLVMLCSTSFCALLLLRKKYQVKLQSVLSVFRIEKAMFKSIGGYLGLCFPLALVSSTVILERNVDVLMLGSLDLSLIHI